MTPPAASPRIAAARTTVLGALLVGLAVASVLSTAPASGRLARLQGTTLHVQRLEAALALELSRGRLGVVGDAQVARCVERVRSASSAFEREVREGYGDGAPELSTSLARQRQAMAALDDATETLLRESRDLRRLLDRLPGQLGELGNEVPMLFTKPALVECLTTIGRDLLEVASTPIGGDLRWIDTDLARLAELREDSRGVSKTAVGELEQSLATLRDQLQRVARAAASCRSFEVSGSAGRIFDTCARIEQLHRDAVARRQVFLSGATAALCVVLAVVAVGAHRRGRPRAVPLVSRARLVAEARALEAHHPPTPIADSQRRVTEAAAPSGDAVASESAGVPAVLPAETHQAAPEVESVDLSGRRLLVAEDGRDNQRLMRHLLARTGAAVTIVADGEEAVRAALDEESAEHPFDLVLMDMSMPEKDGYRATQELRSAGFRKPIVALTAHALPDDRERCLAAGCDEYLTKPVDRAHLHATLRRLAEVALEPDSDTDEPIVSEFSDDEEMLELIEWFVRDLDRDVEAMERALETGDVARIGVLAHQLKGSAGSYGFPQLTAQADRVESCLREGGDQERLETEVRTFLGLCGRARAK